MIQRIHEEEFHLALETTGNYSLEKLRKVEPYVDLFLMDCKHLDSEKLYHATGADYDQIMEKVMNEYTGIYYAYECRNWAVSPKVHDARLRADNQVLVATSFNNVWLEP